MKVSGAWFDTAVGRFKLVTLIFGLLSIASLTVQLDRGIPAGYRYSAMLGMGLLLVTILVTSLLGRLVMLYDGPAIAVALILFEAGLQVPDVGIGAAIGIIVALAPYSPIRSAMVRVACLLPTPYLAVLASPKQNDMAGAGSKFFGSVVALVLFGILLQTLKSAIEGQAESNARQRYLARLSQQLLGTTSYDDILRQLKTANMELVELSPGLVVVPANVQAPSKRHPRGSAQIMGVAGAETPPSRNLPTDIILPLEKEDLDAFPAVPGGTAELMECGLPRRQWYAYGIDRESGDSLGVNLMLYGVPMGFRARFLGMSGRPRTELMDAIRSTAALAMMAKRNTQMYMELTQQAHHDELTAMPNRSVLFSELDHAVKTAAPGQVIGALIIDLDDFKQINDAGGHAAGDVMLVEVGNRISQLGGRVGVAARFGGDEFAVLVPNVRDLGQLHDLAENILGSIAEPVQIGGGTVHAQASIGIAVTGDGITGTDLLRCADIAMYSAKASGKGRIDIFSHERHGSVARTRRLEEQISPQQQPT